MNDIHQFNTDPVYSPILLALIVMLLGTTPAPAQTYSIRNLGVQSPHVKSYARDLNNKGEVTGYTSNDLGTQTMAFFIGPPYDDMIAIPNFMGDTTGQGRGINDSGVVVGYSFEPSGGSVKATLWSNGVLSTLSDAMGNSVGQLFDINDAGEISGSVGSDSVLYSKGESTTLLIPLGHSTVFPDAVNNNSLTVGYATKNASLETRAVRWNTLGGVGFVPDLGGEQSQALDIADNGLIVGWSYESGMSAARAFMTPDGGSAMPLGSMGDYSRALGTNGTEIVGVFGMIVGESSAFIYKDGVMTDLNDLIPADSGWILQTAEAVNDYGQICGRGEFMGQDRAYLLTPIEPRGGAADWNFAERDNGWTAAASIPPFEPAEAAWAPGLGFGVRATGLPCFAFLQSPELTLREGTSYRLFVTVASDSLLINGTPQIRLRAFQTGNNQADFLALDSVDMVLPSSAAATFEFGFTPITDGSPPLYRFYLDFTHFNPEDDQTATVYLQRVLLTED